MKKALDADPLSLIINANFVWVYREARQDGLAMEQAHKTLEIDSDFGVVHERLEEVYEQKGMIEQALGEIPKRNKEGQRMAPLLRRAYAKSGARGYWQKMLNGNEPTIEAQSCLVGYATRGEAALFGRQCKAERARALYRAEVHSMSCRT